MATLLSHLKTPWNGFCRFIRIVRARWFLRHCQLGTSVYAEGPVYARGSGSVRLGSRVTFVSNGIGSEITAHEGATVEIGSGVVFNYGLCIEAWNLVKIGNGCMFGSFVRIADRGPIASGPVVLEDDVWVAHGAIIEPGVTVGKGSVVSAGAVVATDIPPNCMAVGNPARAMSLELRSANSSPP